MLWEVLGVGDHKTSREPLQESQEELWCLDLCFSPGIRGKCLGHLTFGKQEFATYSCLCATLTQLESDATGDENGTKCQTWSHSFFPATWWRQHTWSHCSFCTNSVNFDQPKSWPPPFPVSSNQPCADWPPSSSPYSAYWPHKNTAVSALANTLTCHGSKMKKKS